MLQNCTSLSTCSYQILNHLGNQGLILGFRAHYLSSRSQQYSPSFFKAAVAAKGLALIPFYLNANISNTQPHPISCLSFPGVIGRISALSSKLMGSSTQSNAITTTATIAIALAIDFLGGACPQPPSTLLCPGRLPDSSTNQQSNKLWVPEIILAATMSFTSFIEYSVITICHIINNAFGSTHLDDANFKDRDFIFLKIGPLFFVIGNFIFSKVSLVTQEFYAISHQGPLGYAPFTKADIVIFIAFSLITLMKSSLIQRMRLPYLRSIGMQNSVEVVTIAALSLVVWNVMTIFIRCENR